MSNRVKSRGRQERLAAALRENLKRRKARQRALADKQTAARSGAEGSRPESLPDRKAD